MKRLFLAVVAGSLCVGGYAIVVTLVICLFAVVGYRRRCGRKRDGDRCHHARKETDAGHLSEPAW